MDELVPTQKSRKDSGGSRRSELWVSQAQVRAWVGVPGSMEGWGCRRGAFDVSMMMGSYGKPLNKKSDR